MPFHAIGLHIQDCDSDSSVGDIVIDNVFLAENGRFFITESNQYLEQDLVTFAPSPTGSTFTVTGAGGMTLLRVPSGTYQQGSPSTDSDRTNNEPYRQVTISKDFYLGEYEVTQAQYEAVMTGNLLGLSATPSASSGDDKPVTNVKRSDVESFLSILNGIEQAAGRLPTGWQYDLPTEAEWEYAVRFMEGGTYYKYSVSCSANGSPPLTGVNINSTGTTNVGNYSSDVVLTYGSPLVQQDFFDMIGNVSEWVKDKYVNLNNYTTAVTDPLETVPSSTINPDMFKGGNWGISATRKARTAYRERTSSNFATGYVGFRLALRQT